MTMKGLFSDETRWQHFLYAMPIGLVFTILCVLGGLVGQIVQLFIIALAWR